MSNICSSYYYTTVLDRVCLRYFPEQKPTKTPWPCVLKKCDTPHSRKIFWITSRAFSSSSMFDVGDECRSHLGEKKEEEKEQQKGLSSWRREERKQMKISCKADIGVKCWSGITFHFQIHLYAYAHIMASNCTSSVGKQQGGGWGTSRDREHMSVIKFVKGNITNYFNVSLCMQWGREKRTHSGWRL